MLLLIEHVEEVSESLERRYDLLIVSPDGHRVSHVQELVLVVPVDLMDYLLVPVGL